MNRNLLLLSALLLVCVSFINSTPLDDYVNKPDNHYGYEVIQKYVQTGYTLFILNFTSQKWLDETVVKNPIWWHFLCIAVPDKITRPDGAFLLIDGGNNGNHIPKPTDNFVQLVSTFAVATGTIGADLQQIPNQPTVFLKDPTLKRRTEDAVIAWTWKTFLENPNDPDILLRLPMTKAAVRAMDATTEFTAKMGVAHLEKWLVAGASKRGWATWTTAAVDKRVIAAVPIVMDMLNLNRGLHTHYRALGGWTFAFKDYYDLNVTKHTDSRAMFDMQKVIDPLYYMDRYKDIKILAVTTAGDEFFMGDDTYSYWSDLKAATQGSAMLKRLPNAEHSCAGHEISIFFTLRSFFLSVYEKQNLPSVHWARPNNETHGVITAYVEKSTGRLPSDVRVYYAHTLDNKRRDFRLVKAGPNGKPIPHPVIWLNTKHILEVTETKDKIAYKASFIKPIESWLGFFIQFSFPGLDSTVLEITTETNFVPEYYPFEDCYGQGCVKSLV